MSSLPPLDGIRVIDMAPLGPGPHCSQVLADLGAAIVRIEQPGPGEGKRAGRLIRMPADAPIRRDARALALNLKHEAGREVFYKLAANADVVVEGYRPGVVKRLGVDYETLRRLKPDIVYASLSGYGQDGPYASYVGHDINYQAVTGILSMTGRPDGPPVIPGNTIADNAGGGMNAVIGILAALFARDRTGAGRYIDMAMIDGLMTMMFLTVDDYLTTGEVPHRGETLLTGREPWYNVYETKDGKYVAVGAIEPWFYENLCRALGRGDLASQQHVEGAQREAVFTAFREAFLTKTRDEWVAELMPAETCVSPVYAIDEVTRDPHLRGRGLIVEVEAPDGSCRTQVGAMVRFAGGQDGVRGQRSRPEEQAQQVLRELGYDDDAIDALRRAEAIA
jgi:crotonobetainyl-CoA:carnitine CoA-transferase CaiB-like acyl-CoA transferase